tara:strand:+ start:961 stop:1581 length:621 start_codon:yes stop_codon:yes gene_type:complete
MPYYKQKNILFIHIPKTGGTVIENALKKETKQTLYGNKNNWNEPYRGISPQHLFYNTIFKNKRILNVDFQNIKVFSVVRNPYDRIVSDLFWNKLIEPTFTAKEVNNVIRNIYFGKCKKNLDNHNVPQYKFVTDENSELIKSIKILKTETLNESNNTLNEFLGFNINIFQKNVNKNYREYLNKESISIINEKYKKDFELFDYEMIKE